MCVIALSLFYPINMIVDSKSRLFVRFTLFVKYFSFFDFDLQTTTPCFKFKLNLMYSLHNMN